MVLKHIKHMLGIEHLEVAGNLYKNKALKVSDASITISNERLVVQNAEKRVEFPLSEISYIDFSKTESKEFSVFYLVKQEKWIFVFRQNLPRTIVQFYGKLFAAQPEINKWNIIYTNDSVTLKKYSPVTDKYELVDESISVRMIKIGESIVLRVYKQYEIIRKGDLVENYSDFYVDQETNSFSWHVASHHDGLEVYRLIFNGQPALFAFVSSFVNASSKEEVEYLEKMEIDNYMEDQEVSSSEEEISEEEESDDAMVIGHKKASASTKCKQASGNIFGGRNKERNRALAVNEKNTFISRGSSIGIFQNEQSELDFKGTLNNIFRKGESITPNKMVISKDNSSLIMSDLNNKEMMHKIDLNTEKVAESWDTKDELKDFFTAAKDERGAPLSNEFVGVSKNRLFKLDPRSPTLIEGKSYSTNTKFTSGDSTSNGYFALGSETGDIRMYDSLEKRAKTLLPGLGDSVLGVFISPSGKYLVGTCKTYLMLVVTEKEGVSGFKKSLGQSKPIPKKLIVRPEHLHYFNGAVNFTNASISTDKDEKYVIVSTGEWVLVWDMEKVLKGHVFNYQIKKNEHNVVSNSFIPGDSNRIVVAMDDDIAMVNRLSLKKARNPHK
ncbi:uncharacterized protein NEMAJ01_0062 [Nematocida major]|uniref:uncharacterized protein n=1 Tax=Nematocida major TaxID=1912982 RepID=UPI0020078C94|nr:uncharacterized protein NEMAJ01_0062 [Nematocida major]KAH9385166.1 hypothetical protein NEMAJ01_0062 [Nematocida major]